MYSSQRRCPALSIGYTARAVGRRVYLWQQQKWLLLLLQACAVGRRRRALFGSAAAVRNIFTARPFSQSAPPSADHFTRRTSALWSRTVDCGSGIEEAIICVVCDTYPPTLQRTPPLLAERGKLFETSWDPQNGSFVFTILMRCSLRNRLIRNNTAILNRTCYRVKLMHHCSTAF